MSTPLQDGLLWNQAELERNHPLNNLLLLLIAIGDNHIPKTIGTAFIVQSNGTKATAVSAAHCFEEMRKILHPEPVHHTSALPEFLGPPKEIELGRVKAIYTKEERIYTCEVSIAAWDSATDFAVLDVSCATADDNTFRDMAWITDDIPAVGDEVAMFGYGNLKEIADPADMNRSTIQRQLIMRVGTVENFYPEGFYLLKSPCIETTIPVYGGMSGGIAARFEPGSQIRVFGFISHGPFPPPEDCKVSVVRIFETERRGIVGRIWRICCRCYAALTR